MATTILPTLPKVGSLFAKALVNSFDRPDPSKGLPGRSVAVDDLQQDVVRAAEYARVCGFSVREHVPSTWLHVLTFPLQTHIMAQKDFPFPLAGLVHVTNQITQHRPVSVTEKLRLDVEATNLQPHKKGVTFDFHGRIHVGDELVWEGLSNYRATKSTLPGDAPEVERERAPEAEPSQQWRIPADLGRRYAKVSDDSNPIHLHPLTARLFGFPRPIIHGMWTQARALAAYGGDLPEDYTVRVQFTKPIMMPSVVGFASDKVDGARRFAVVGRDDKPRLVGSIR